MLLLWLPWQAMAQGFAGPWQRCRTVLHMPQPDPPLQFPADHGAHPDYRIEWWYLTANLTGPDGTPYGLQWTLFRSALAPRDGQGWDDPQLWMGHAAVTTPDAHFVTERLARGGIGQAGVDRRALRRLDRRLGAAGAGSRRCSLTASGPDFAYDVALTATGPLGAARATAAIRSNPAARVRRATTTRNPPSS